MAAKGWLSPIVRQPDPTRTISPTALTPGGSPRVKASWMIEANFPAASCFSQHCESTNPGQSLMTFSMKGNGIYEDNDL